MTDWTLAGVHGLNKYIWSLLQSELGWSAGTYGGLVPITVPQQQPEFNVLNAPYLVYSYSKVNTGDDFFIEGEVIAYTIYSSQEVDIRKVVNMLTSKLNKRDESAKELNAFIGGWQRGVDDYVLGEGSAANKEFDYKWLAVTNAQGAQPSDEEAGRMDGMVMVRLSYTHYGIDGNSVRY